MMKWAAKYKRVETPDGETRIIKPFAWFPVYIGGIMVWLERYEVLQVYRITEQRITIDNEKMIFSPGQWVKLTKRCKD